MTTLPKELKCLQLNLQHCAAASALLAQIVLELNILTQSLCKNPISLLTPTLLPTSLMDIAYSILSQNDHAYGAIIIYKSNLIF